MDKKDRTAKRIALIVLIIITVIRIFYMGYFALAEANNAGEHLRLSASYGINGIILGGLLYLYAKLGLVNGGRKKTILKIIGLWILIGSTFATIVTLLQ